MGCWCLANSSSQTFNSTTQTIRLKDSMNLPPRTLPRFSRQLPWLSHQANPDSQRRELAWWLRLNEQINGWEAKFICPSAYRQQHSPETRKMWDRPERDRVVFLLLRLEEEHSLSRAHVWISSPSTNTMRFLLHSMSYSIIFSSICPGHGLGSLIGPPLGTSSYASVLGSLSTRGWSLSCPRPRIPCGVPQLYGKHLD
jgi:hypothetical protein